MDTVKNLLQSFSMYTTAITIVFAVLNCFLGYKLLKTWIGIVGFFIGFLAGFGVGMKCVDHMTLALLIGACAGAVCTVVAFRVYLAGVFILAFCWSYTMLRLIPQPESGEVWQIIMIAGALLISAVAGVAAVKFTRPVVIGLSAFSGGTKTVHYLMPLFGITDSSWIWAGGLLLAAVGTVYQMHATGKRR